MSASASDSAAAVLDLAAYLRAQLVALERHTEEVRRERAEHDRIVRDGLAVIGWRLDRLAARVAAISNEKE